MPRPSVQLAPRDSRPSPPGWRWGPRVLHGASMLQGLSSNELDLFLRQLGKWTGNRNHMSICLLRYCRRKNAPRIPRLIWDPSCKSLWRWKFQELLRDSFGLQPTWDNHLPAFQCIPITNPGTTDPHDHCLLVIIIIMIRIWMHYPYCSPIIHDNKLIINIFHTFTRINSFFACFPYSLEYWHFPSGNDHWSHWS